MLSWEPCVEMQAERVLASAFCVKHDITTSTQWKKLRVRTVSDVIDEGSEKLYVPEGVHKHPEDKYKKKGWRPARKNTKVLWDWWTGRSLARFALASSYVYISAHKFFVATKTHTTLLLAKLLVIS